MQRGQIRTGRNVGGITVVLLAFVVIILLLEIGNGIVNVGPTHSAGATFPASAPRTLASATPAQTTISGWNGWGGNAVIYPTIFPNVTLLSAQSASGISTQLPGSACGSGGCGYNGTWPSNDIGVSTATGVGQSYYQNSGPPNYQFTQYSFVSAGSVSQYYTTECPTQNFSCSVNNRYQDLPALQEIVANLFALPSGFVTNILDSDEAINLTGALANGNPSGTSTAVAGAVNEVISFLGTINPVIGAIQFTAQTIQYLMTLLGPNAAFSSPSFTDSLGPVAGSPTSQVSVNQWMATTNGNELNGSYQCAGNLQWNYPNPDPCAPTSADTHAANPLGWNSYAQGLEIETYTGANSLSAAESLFAGVTSGAYEQLYAQNEQEVETSNAQVVYGNSLYHYSANASITYDYLPAEAFRGTVISGSGGSPVSGATVTLAQNCPYMSRRMLTDYEVTTGPQGAWQFLGEPDCANSISATYASAVGTVSSPTESLATASDVTGGMYTFPALPLSQYPVTASESGLPSGDSWSFSLGESSGKVVSASTTNNQVTVYAPNGTYTESGNPPSGYTSSPSSYAVTVAGASPSTNTFTIAKQTTYSVTFDESGLPSSVSWAVSIGSTTNSATTPASIGFSALSGTNSYSIPDADETIGCGVLLSWYAPSPASGSVSGATTVKVGFTYHTASVTLRCAGLSALASRGSAPSGAYLGILVAPGVVAIVRKFEPTP
jgi:hypothetical protein